MVACEFSGIVRDAFIAEGHDAISCDLLPTEEPGPHIQGDVRPLLREPWDLVIAHPPCTRLTMLNHTFRLPEKMVTWQVEYEAARDFFQECLAANAPRVAVENPLPHPLARAELGEFDILTCPRFFGASFSKRTAFWLRGLPPLLNTYVRHLNDTVPLVHTGYPTMGRYGRNEKQGLSSCSGGKERSRFHPGMAAAMAKQWGSY